MTYRSYQNLVGKLTCLVIDGTQIVRAVKYLNPNQVIRVTRRRYGWKIVQAGLRAEVLVSHCRPNYRERQYIKVLKKAGEPFPVKKIQLQLQPAKRAV